MVFLFGTGRASAEPLGPTTARDADDVRKQLDIRSVTVDTLSKGRTLVEIVFWNGIPPSFLKHRAAGVAALCCYVVRFWPNRNGRLRVTWGDAASSCCAVRVARHPNPYTCFTILPLDQVMPPATRIRGYAMRKLDCSEGIRCGSGWRPAPVVDRTPGRAL